MKQFFLLLFFSLFLLNVQAQIKPFAPLGAQWSFFSADWNSSIHYSIFVEEQIEIEGKICSVVCRGDTENCNNSEVSEIVYTEGEKVYIYRDSTFYLFYDFGAEVGDTIEVFNESFEPLLYQEGDYYWEGELNYFAYTITKVDSVERNGLWLKRQEVESIGDWRLYQIIELEGSQGTVFGGNPYILATGDATGANLCYNDGTYIFPLSGSPLLCNDPVGIELNLNETEITISPNPANSFIDIKFPLLDKPHQVKIYNVLGQLVAEADLLTGTSQKQIDVTALSNGLYFWQLGDTIGKLMIE